MPKSEKPIVIRKYANRRLYRPGTSTYVTLAHLTRMVKTGKDFIVYDIKTDDDITRSVLTQILLEQANAGGRNQLPIALLRQLICLYGVGMRMPRVLKVESGSLASEQEKSLKQLRVDRMKRRPRRSAKGRYGLVHK
jgi:polyhydroxyalkanoate synthesis repressor PhaR